MRCYIGREIWPALLPLSQKGETFETPSVAMLSQVWPIVIQLLSHHALLSALYVLDTNGRDTARDQILIPEKLKYW